MDFKLVDSSWVSVFRDAANDFSGDLRIICPFIKQKTAERLVRGRARGRIQVVTRFALRDMCAGVHDMSALRYLLSKGAEIRGIKNLYSKLYIFDGRYALLTSANLTEAALSRNQEFGAAITSSSAIAECNSYFDRLWAAGGGDLNEATLDAWEKKVLAARLLSETDQANGLPDEGADAGFRPAPGPTSDLPAAVNRGWVKFVGRSDSREVRSQTVWNVIEGSGCHRVGMYPSNKRPPKMPEGSTMFFGRLVKDPDDILIFGRGRAIPHIPERDEASDSDKTKHGWVADYSKYVRVFEPRFLSATLAAGVSLHQMIRELGTDAFGSTQERVRSGKKDVNPWLAYRQQASVRLTADGLGWINHRLDAAFARHGLWGQDELQQIDWPELPRL